MPSVPDLKGYHHVVKELILLLCISGFYLGAQSLIKERQYHYPVTIVQLYQILRTLLMVITCRNGSPSTWSQLRCKIEGSCCSALAKLFLLQATMHQTSIAPVLLAAPFTNIILSLTENKITSFGRPETLYSHEIFLICAGIWTLLNLFTNESISPVGIILAPVSFLLHGLYLRKASDREDASQSVSAKIHPVHAEIIAGLSGFTLTLIGYSWESLPGSIRDLQQNFYTVSFVLITVVMTSSGVDVYLEHYLSSCWSPLEKPHPESLVHRTWRLISISAFLSIAFDAFHSGYLLRLEWLMEFLLVSIPIDGYEKGLGFLSNQVPDCCPRTGRKLLKALMIATSVVICWLLIYRSTQVLEIPSQTITLQAITLQETACETTVDVVIAHYDEPRSELDTLLEGLWTMFEARGIQLRIFIYCKGHLDIDFPKAREDQIHISHLPNRGRETETFLHHMITQGAQAADHMLFTQAAIHNNAGFFIRLDRYFIPKCSGSNGFVAHHTGFMPLGSDTRPSHGRGFLSLGAAADVTSCVNARDRHSWHDYSGLIPYLFENINALEKSPCSVETPVLLTYKSQFIVSRTRMLSVPSQVLEDMQQALTTDVGWGHEFKDKVPGTSGKVDGISHPLFGYSVERAWSILFGCNDVENVTKKCPSFLGDLRWSNPKELRECQCLDISPR